MKNHIASKTDKIRSIAVTLTPALLLAALALTATPANGQTALDDYVAAPDASYTWSHVGTHGGSGYTFYVLDMTSQTWLTTAEVDRPQWQHWVTIVKPTSVVSNKAMMWIGGGSNGGSAPTSPDSMLAAFALATNTIVAEVKMIPNQRLKFTDESDPRYIANGRKEDALIAYTWDKHMTTGDDKWPARLPMTKAVVRAMDAVTAFCATPTGGSLTIDEYVVGGASKRGWTTWTTAAVDARVIAIAPVVIDVLSVERSMLHHWASYGFWADAIGDYTDMNITDWFDTPQMDALMAIVDPYAYLARYTMPKFVVNSSGDDFFLPDSSQFYFHDLPADRYLRYVPNTDHGLDGSDAPDSLLAFYQSVLNSWTRPTFSWTVQPDKAIHVQTVTAPNQVNLWQATNTSARDFRKNAYPGQGHPAPTPVWSSSALTDQGGGLYIGQVTAPPSGWTAYFVELVYNTAGPAPYKFTTDVCVLPILMPYGADLDRDTDVDGNDFLTFSVCYNSSLMPPAAACQNLEADFDADGNVDGQDFLTYSVCYNGALNPPRCP